MKKRLQSILQRLLGFRRYLFWFSLFKIKTLKWDKGEGDFHFFLTMLKRDSNVIDIGANIGIMTALLAKRCPDGQVLAIEPIPENFEALKRINSHFHFTNTTLLNCALGPEEGELKMVMPHVENVKMQGLSHVVHESITEFNEGDFYTVPQHKLDDLKELKGRKIDAIKIDVENFEYFVFSGATEILRKYQPVIYCELWDNENRQKCFDLLAGELGYGIKVLENNVLVEFEKGKHEQQNFFFMKEK